MRAGESRNRLRTRMFGSLSLVCGFSIGMLVLELLVRIVAPQVEPEKWYRSHPKYGYVNRADFYQEVTFHSSKGNSVMRVQTNSLGHRDREYNLTASDCKRILLLGDSFTFGYGANVKDLFDTRLEELLNGLHGCYQVINAGVVGWGTLQQVEYAQDHFDIFNPDLVVITFCSNDPYNDTQYRFRIKDKEKGGAFYFPGKVFLRENSHLYRLIYKLFHRMVYDVALRWKLGGKYEQYRKEMGDLLAGRALTPDDLVRSLGFMRDFRDRFREFNPHGVVLLQATEPWNQMIKQYLSSSSNGEDLLYVDLSEDASRLTEKTLGYDAHWNAQMHAVSAKNLFETIEGLGDPARKTSSSLPGPAKPSTGNEN